MYQISSINLSPRAQNNFWTVACHVVAPKKVLGRLWLISERKMLKNSKHLIGIQKAVEQECLICIF